MVLLRRSCFPSEHPLLPQAKSVLAQRRQLADRVVATSCISFLLPLSRYQQREPFSRGRFLWADPPLSSEHLGSPAPLVTLLWVQTRSVKWTIALLAPDLRIWPFNHSRCRLAKYLHFTHHVPPGANIVAGIRA